MVSGRCEPGAGHSLYFEKGCKGNRSLPAECSGSDPERGIQVVRNRMITQVASSGVSGCGHRCYKI